MDSTRYDAETSKLPDISDFGETPVLSRYEVFEEVGRGGMGVVYRGRHRMLDEPVALKICLPGREIERFQREAKLLSSIRSMHIVRVRDYELLPGGQAMLVMDWVDGQDLGRILKNAHEPLPEHRVLPWMQQVSQGMSTAAEQGIVHRDLKPSNILVDHDDQAHVADFGLARSEWVDPLSLSGALMGTPHYMAPEQAEDPRGVDSRADIYSFGATFYHALTGKPPFEGETAFSVLYKHKTEPLVSPSAHRPAISKHTCELIERCLAKVPADRFSSFTELQNRLRPTPTITSPWMIADDSRLAAYQERYQAKRDDYLNEEIRWDEDLDVYSFPRGQALRIIRGDLVNQRVDALVSSDTCHLYMNFGVSAAIREAAGPQIERELEYQSPVRPGRAVVTSAGDLPSRFVFHGVTVGFVEGELVSASRDLITEIMHSCFYHADSYELRSIAFPLLATGGQGFPRQDCLDTMFQFLARIFLRGLTSVREARIVIFPDSY